MSKRARNPDVPEISAATREAFKSELAQKMQVKAENKLRRLGWGARLEAAALAATEIEASERAQKPEKAKKSKQKRKHKKHKKKHKTPSSGSDSTSVDDNRRKAKKHKTSERRASDDTTSGSDSERNGRNKSKSAQTP